MTGSLMSIGGKVNLTRTRAMALSLRSQRTRCVSLALATPSRDGRHVCGMIELAERFLERRQRWSYLDCRSDLVGYGLLCLEPVAGNVGHHQLIAANLAAGDELLEAGDGHSAGGFGEDALGLRQQLDAVHDLLIRGGFGGPTRFLDDLQVIVAIGWIADGQ